MQSENKKFVSLYLIIFLVISVLLNITSLIYIIKQKPQPKISLPEEYHLIDEKDSLKATFKNDSLIIEFNNFKNQNNELQTKIRKNITKSILEFH